eukprot:TRINITY_DN18399_c0_g1_i2.p1 TRINITY_DN18399_c0_g1~~TRINITY_DN18399_c0_g1_i2.p1  ORF type:complete len:448 (+),score=31.09 TRINITY_DN18399_c0_g1_i2:87-1430(+)
MKSNLIAGVTAACVVAWITFTWSRPACESALSDSPLGRRRDEHAYRQYRGGRIVVTMATNLERRKLVPLVVESLIYQTVNATCIVVILNGYESVPTHWKMYDRVEYYIPPVDLGASGKFFDRGFIRKFRYHLTADDDIIYPSNYVERLIEQITMLGGRAIVGVHCRNLTLLKNGALAFFLNAHNPKRFVVDELQLAQDSANLILAAYRYEHEQYVHHFRDNYVGGFTDVVGTGTAGYLTGKFMWDLEDIPPKGMVTDYTTALMAKRNGLEFYCMSRRSLWMKPLPFSSPTDNGIYTTLLQTPSRIEELVLLAMKLDLWHNLTSNRIRSNVRVMYRGNSRIKFLRLYEGVLPFECDPFFTHGEARWKCLDASFLGLRQQTRLWQVQSLRVDNRPPLLDAGSATVLPPEKGGSSGELPFKKGAEKRFLLRSVVSLGDFPAQVACGFCPL